MGCGNLLIILETVCWSFLFVLILLLMLSSFMLLSSIMIGYIWIKTPKIADEVIEVWYSKWSHQYYLASYVKWNICDQKNETDRAWTGKSKRKILTYNCIAAMNLDYIFYKLLFDRLIGVWGMRNNLSNFLFLLYLKANIEATWLKLSEYFHEFNMSLQLWGPITNLIDLYGSAILIFFIQLNNISLLLNNLNPKNSFYGPNFSNALMSTSSWLKF